ncbi:MAG: DUF1552 domain-containing protein [Rhodopirellula sp.]|nr:DUF1552 domain-containing protein [Rhodopirellula sp.]
MKSWQLDRRTLLKGVGVSLALPMLDCMGSETSQVERPKRFCATYFPYGSVFQNEDSEFAKWNWTPAGEGPDFTFGEIHRSMEPLRNDLTMLEGLSHPNGRSMGGHDTADIWLTGSELTGSRMKNTMSLDQIIAAHHMDQTRYSSLVLSTDGGVGEPTRSSTLSYNRNGQPIPAQNKPRVVFDRLFGVKSDSVDSQRSDLQRTSSMLDRILEHSRSVRRQLGKHDQKKFDEYLASVRQIEQGVERSKQWLEIPKPRVDDVGLSLDADDSTPQELIQTMYDLMFLAFQTDSIRVATYQLGNMNGATSIAGKFPQLLGLGNTMHTLAHGGAKGKGGEALGKWHQFLTDQMARFLTRLKSTEEGDGSLLDHTIVLYGSSNSQTHRNANYPLMLAGGQQLGLKHGRLIKSDEQTPLSNVYVTVLNQLGVKADTFADSTARLDGLLS